MGEEKVLDASILENEGYKVPMTGRENHTNFDDNRLVYQRKGRRKDTCDNGEKNNVDGYHNFLQDQAQQNKSYFDKNEEKHGVDDDYDALFATLKKRNDLLRQGL